MMKSALDRIAECFTAEESREALSFETTIKEFSEFVETEVQYEQTTAEYESYIMSPLSRYAE